MSNHDQLGFDALLAEAETDNRQRQFEQDTAHLPNTWAEAVIHHQKQMAAHHAAMLECDFETALDIREDTHLLARKLNKGDLGILASDDAPGCRLEIECAAEPSTVPLWGQSGCFELDSCGMRVRVEMEGMFGIGATAMTYLGFAVHAVDFDAPFLSSTGYRSFLGVAVEPKRGMTVDGFVRRVIEVCVAQELNGWLEAISPRFKK